MKDASLVATYPSETLGYDVNSKRIHQLPQVDWLLTWFLSPTILSLASMQAVEFGFIFAFAQIYSVNLNVRAEDVTPAVPIEVHQHVEVALSALRAQLQHTSNADDLELSNKFLKKDSPRVVPEQLRMWDLFIPPDMDPSPHVRTDAASRIGDRVYTGLAAKTTADEVEQVLCLASTAISRVIDRSLTVRLDSTISKYVTHLSTLLPLTLQLLERHRSESGVRGRLCFHDAQLCRMVGIRLAELNRGKDVREGLFQRATVMFEASLRGEPRTSRVQRTR